MKAIPDLDFAAKQIKPSSVTASSQNPQSGAATLEHRVSKPQHKLSGKEGGSRRGSGEMDCAVISLGIIFMHCSREKNLASSNRRLPKS